MTYLGLSLNTTVVWWGLTLAQSAILILVRSQVLQELGTENVNIKGSQMSEIIGLLKLEDVLDEKEKEEQTKQSTDGPTEKKPASEDVVDASKGAQVEDVQAPPK